MTNTYKKFKTPVAGYVNMAEYRRWYKETVVTDGWLVPPYGNVIVRGYEDAEGIYYDCTWQHSAMGSYVPSRFVTLFAIAEEE